MKINKKITSLGLALTMALGVGVAVSAVNHQELQTSAATPVTADVDLSAGVLAGEPLSATWTEPYSVIEQLKGFSTNDVAYTSAPRAYKGHYFTFEAPEGVTFNKIVFKCTAKDRVGGGFVYYAESTTANAARPDGDGSALPTNAIKADAAVGTVLTFNLNDARSVYIQNGFMGMTETYKQIRITDISITYTSTIVVVDPTSINVSFAKSELTSLGEKTQATAEVLPAEATDKTVTWSSSNESVASVDATGLVTAVGNGTATIKAVSKSVTTVFGEADITANVPAPTVYDKSITTDNGLHTNGYATEIVAIENVCYSTVDFGVMQGHIQGKANSGKIASSTALPNDIKNITTTLVTDGDPTFTLTVGATADAVTTVVTPDVVGNVATYTTAAGNKFFAIKAGSTYFTLTSIVIEMVDTNVEAGRGYATSFLSTTAAECAAKAVTAETWGKLKTSFEALSADAKAALTGELHSVLSVTDIQKALQRYLLIVSLYGYENFMGLTLSGANNTISNPINANNGMIAIVAIVSIISVATCVLVVLSVKKRKHN